MSNTLPKAFFCSSMYACPACLASSSLSTYIVADIQPSEAIKSISIVRGATTIPAIVDTDVSITGSQLKFSDGFIKDGDQIKVILEAL